VPKIVKKTQEQKSAEADVEGYRRELGPYVVAVETSRIAMLFTDANASDNPIVFANESFLTLTGYDRAEVLGQSFNALLARGVDAPTREKVETAVGGGADDELVVRYRRKNGSEFWADIFISPVRDARGDLVQHFISFIDLTRHKDDQARLERLIDELNHRVKNTLSTVQSIVGQALRRSSDPAVVQAAIETRLLALSRLHDLLTSENWEGAGLRDLVGSVLKPFGMAGDAAERFEISDFNVRLTPKITLALGVALLELATNAAKYGALSTDQGIVALSWAIETTPGGDRLMLRWSENDGPPVRSPIHKGFGSQVLERGLPHELGAVVRLEFPPTGVVCVIDLPAPQTNRHV
jgi:PAS domain S-box-containing protein